MTYFTEIDWTEHTGGRIVAVLANSVAADIGLQNGDQLLAVNESKVADVIDVQFYAAEEKLELLIRREEEYLLFEAERAYDQKLGIEFEHPTFDTDIRRCNNLCPFCFVLQMAPRFRRTLYIKDDDYRYSFLFGHFVTLTNLSEHDWWRIETMGLSPLYVSVHVTDLDLRRQFLRNPNAPDIKDQLRWLADRRIKVHAQLVIVPEFNDGKWLQKSIDDLVEFWPEVESVSIVPVGLTRHHKYDMRPHTQEEAGQLIDYIESLQPEFKERLGVRFLYLTDEWFLVSGRQVPKHDYYDGLQLQENGLGMVRGFLDEWRRVKSEIQDWISGNSRQGQLTKPRSLTLVTGTLFAPILSQTTAEFADLTGAQVNVKPIVNQRLGGTITAAGLLMAEDIVAQLEEVAPENVIVLPRVVFDHPDGISLDDLTPQDLADRLNRPVALADMMGDVWDAYTGQSSVMYYPNAG